MQNNEQNGKTTITRYSGILRITDTSSPESYFIFDVRNADGDPVWSIQIVDGKVQFVGSGVDPSDAAMQVFESTLKSLVDQYIEQFKRWDDDANR